MGKSFLMASPSYEQFAGSSSRNFMQKPMRRSPSSASFSYTRLKSSRLAVSMGLVSDPLR